MRILFRAGRTMLTNVMCIYDSFYMQETPDVNSLDGIKLCEK